MADVTVQSFVDTFMTSANAAAALAVMDGLTVTLGMTKAVYDPQAVGKISGGTTGAGTGGVLSMVGSDVNAGTITTDAGAAAPGGNIDTHGGGATADGGRIATYGINAAGGSINTYGVNSIGGSIDTYDGGGSIDTRGTGTIQLGANGTRTILNGGATSNRNITFMDADGTVANQAFVTIANALTQSAISPIADGTYTVGIGLTQNGLITVASGVVTGITQAS